MADCRPSRGSASSRSWARARSRRSTSAIEEPLGRTVALKVAQEHDRADVAVRGAARARGARARRALSHPNIGLLYEFVKTRADVPRARVRRRVQPRDAPRRSAPRCRPTSSPTIGAAVARGLAHAHERGIVHRDIKPANILVQQTRRGEDLRLRHRAARARGRGHAEPLAPTRVEDVAAFGTPAYMSPEQILGEIVDARSDLFSLGVVLYQLLCGARPFERGDERTGARPLTASAATRPSRCIDARRTCRGRSSASSCAAIEKLPADRFQTADALAEQLEEFARSRVRPAWRGAARARARARRASSAPTEATRRRARRGARANRRAERSRGWPILGALAVGHRGRRCRRRRTATETPPARGRSSSLPAHAGIPARARDAVGRGVGRRPARRRDAVRAADSARPGDALRDARAPERAAEKRTIVDRSGRDADARRRDGRRARRRRRRGRERSAVGEGETSMNKRPSSRVRRSLP